MFYMILYLEQKYTLHKKRFPDSVSVVNLRYLGTYFPVKYLKYL